MMRVCTSSPRLARYKASERAVHIGQAVPTTQHIRVPNRTFGYSFLNPVCFFLAKLHWLRVRDLVTHVAHW